MSCHRDHIRPIIASIIKQYKNDQAKLKKALFDAYPYGERKYWPYKVWLSEIRNQLGKKKIKTKQDTETMPMFPEEKK